MLSGFASSIADVILTEAKRRKDMEPNKPTKRDRRQDPSPAECESGDSGELFHAVKSTKPLFASNATAAEAASRQLEKLAESKGMTVTALIEQAHTTNGTQDYHIEVLKLDRQLAFLRRR